MFKGVLGVEVEGNTWEWAAEWSVGRSVGVVCGVRVGAVWAMLVRVVCPSRFHERWRKEKQVTRKLKKH